MIRCIIVDDEPLAHELLRTFCERHPRLHVVAHCYDALQALEWLNANKVDIMFLDLNMPKLKGFDLLRTLTYQPKVIVTTAYKEFALDGYELAIEDYLVKPFSFERFLKAVNKAVTSLPTEIETDNNQEVLVTSSSRFFVKVEKQYQQVKREEIQFVEATGNYSTMYFKKEKIVVHEKISDLENRLPVPSFMRVHRSFIVAVEKITSIQGNIIMIGDVEVPIGQSYSKAVRDELLNRG